MQQLTQIVKEVLSNIEVYLDKLDDDAYLQALPLLSDASIGGHTRHMLDGLFCLIRQNEQGIICYEKRERDPKIECETCYAKEKVQEIYDFISSIEKNIILQLTVDYGQGNFTSKSCLARELIHNIEHVIHHLAIIKIALKHYHPAIELPKSFGVAPSTLQYWKVQEMELVKTN